jgi:hypothetical protein
MLNSVRKESTSTIPRETLNISKTTRVIVFISDVFATRSRNISIHTAQQIVELRFNLAFAAAHQHNYFLPMLGTVGTRGVDVKCASPRSSGILLEVAGPTAGQLSVG